MTQSTDMAASTAVELVSVRKVTAKLHALLERARQTKHAQTIEPPLPSSEIAGAVGAIDEDIEEGHDQAYRFATIETASREIFYALIESTDINDPGFVEVWNLLDILLLCGDRGKCTPELVCWLLEELLDSQTTHGCRRVFDYLESRRERLAQKDFHKKNLVFLRSCNELLRRLSRAEDAIFCGRVFFFLFQTFPLGDKSSVNLRGEFHVENATKFENAPAKTEEHGEEMEVDSEAAKPEPETPKPEELVNDSAPQPSSKMASGKATPAKTAKEVPRKTPEEVVLDNSTLYPIFWRLQQDFSDPVRLFDADNFAAFQKGLAYTITKFKKTPVVMQSHADADSDARRGTKRKLGSDAGAGDHLQDNYNPKYLTSRDLFDLELSDLAFQRHIMVQAVILIDFMLSLTEEAKRKLAALESTNKSMLYNYTLKKEDAEWARATRKAITEYIQLHQYSQGGQEGKHFWRMVETVLTRDKNWVRWKVESCPSIVRDPVSTEQEMQARKGAREATRPRRIPDKPMGAMDLSFLEDGGGGGGLEALKAPARYTAPTIESLLKGIENDELDMEMAMTDEEKASLENAKANKTWRALRQTMLTDLAVLDRAEPGKRLEDVFKDADGDGADAEAPAVVVSNGDGEILPETTPKPGPAIAEAVENGVAA